MKFAVLSSDNWHSNQLERAAKSLGHQISRVDFSQLSSTISDRGELIASDDLTLSSADSILVRNMPAGSLEQVVFRMDVLFQLQQQGTDIINSPKAIEMAVDKYLCLARLRAAGIPVPETWVGQSWRAAEGWFRSSGREVVIKPIFGGEGNGLIRVDEKDDSASVFQQLEQTGHVIYMQEYLPHAGFDFRYLVIGTKVWVIKRSNQHDWRTNVSRGATATATTCDVDKKQLAIKAATIADCEFAGVDIVELPDNRTYVLEVNAVPGWRGINRSHNVDIAEELISYAVDKVS